MSKRRNSSPEMPRYLKSTILHKQNPQESSLTKKNHSFFDKTRHRTMKTEVALEDDQRLSTIFNKNISKFRDLVNSNDKSVLPFLSSLRQSSQIKKQKLNFPIKTHLEPFQVAEKMTCNQKLQKDLNDIKGRTKRVSNALYRWHNHTGLGTKNSCFFQSKLRETSSKFRNKDTFLNMFNPIEQRLTEEKIYKPNELICPRQRRLFTLEN